MKNLVVVCVAVACFVGGDVVAQEKVENPLYTTWAKFKPGTSITYQMDTAFGAQSTSAKQVQTLKSVSDDKVVVEMQSVVEAAGQTIKTPAVPLEYLAKVPQGQIDPKFNPDGNPALDVKKGTETIEVAGKSLKCEWIEAKGKTPQGEVETKTWFSDEVPGRLVKSVTGLKAVNSTTTMTLVEFKTK